MKKMMIALAVIAIAGMTQAAMFKWTTSALYAPNADGSVSATAASAASGTWLATVLLYSDAECNTPIANLTGNSSSTVVPLSNAIGDTFGGATFVYDNTTPYYAILELSYTTEDGTQVLKTGVVSTTLKANGNTSLNFSGAIASSSWSAVPEPTSGVLMLLGMAGLALRRKRA